MPPADGPTPPATTGPETRPATAGPVTPPAGWLVHGLLDRAARLSPGRTAIEDGRRRWSYLDLDQLSHAAADWLRSYRVGRGDRVLVQLPNGPELAALLFGASRLGAILAPVHPGVRAFGLRSVIADAEPSLIIGSGTAQAAQAAQALCPGTPCLDLATAWPLIEARRGRRVASPARPEDPALLLYTSGSTAAPRAVVCPHHAIGFAVDVIAARLGYRRTDRVFLCLPMSFDYGLYQLLLCCQAGATLVLGTVGASVTLLRELVGARATVVPAVPSLLVALNQLARRGSARPRVRMFTSTAAALPARIAAEARTNFPGATVVPMYGMTECKRISIEEPDGDRVRPRSVGRPIPGTRVVIVDLAGRPVPTGVTGEITVYGPHVMAGYWRAPGLTARRFRTDPDGATVLFTGDQGHLDAGGHLYFDGRGDDVFKRHGVRVSLTEIEAAAMDVPAVLAAAALRPDREGRAVILVASGRVTASEIRRGLTARLEPAKLPDQIRVVPSVPVTGNGKIDRAAIARLLRSPTPGPAA